MTWHSSASNAPAGAEGDSQCPWNVKDADEYDEASEEEDECPNCGEPKLVSEEGCEECMQREDLR
jgi:hypothetical protein